MSIASRRIFHSEACASNVVEVKAIDALASIHTAQVLTYLRFSDVRLGYLINFNSVMLKDGFRRLVL